MATQEQTFVDKRQGDTLLNSIIGAALGFALGFVTTPLVSYVVGGAAAGYLQDTTRVDGAKVGGIAGTIASIPTLLVILVVFGFGILGVVAGGSEAAAGGVVFLLIVLVAFLAALAFGAGLGAAGGYLGAVLAEN